MVSVDHCDIVLLLNAYLLFQILRKRDINKKMYLFSIFKKEQYLYPLLINMILISVQQFCGNITLMYKVQCTYGVLPLSKLISTMAAILVLQVLTPCYCLLLLIIYNYSLIKCRIFSIFGSKYK